ncbi:MAG: ribonuclease domain-containing protein [Formosimonas sp.]
MLKRSYGWRALLCVVLVMVIVTACNGWRKDAPAVPAHAQNTITTQQQSANPPRGAESKKERSANQRADNNTDNSSGIAYHQLPVEAQQVIDTIKARGRFPYSKDGSVFGNREKLLPYQPKGYYREYTVITPNSSDRGARRIIAGQGSTGDVASSGEYYYTSDHYRSFLRVKP